MTKEEMIALRRSIRMEIATEIEKCDRHSFDMFKSLQLSMEEHRKLDQYAINLITNRLQSLAQTENNLIAELDRCKQYADKMESTLVECARLKSEFISEMAQWRHDIKDDMERSLTSIIIQDIKQRIIEKLNL